MSCRSCWFHRRSRRCGGSSRLYDGRSYARLRRGSCRRRRPHPGRFRRGFLCFFLGLSRRFRLRFGFGYSLNLLADFFGNVGRNIISGPSFINLDCSIAKSFQLTERFRLQVRTDFINALNPVQLNAPNMSLGSTIGQITSAQPPRNIQLALKLYY